MLLVLTLEDVVLARLKVDICWRRISARGIGRCRG